MYRVSFSPAHDMRLSDLRIALINAICATQSQTPLIVRIEDGNRTRMIEGKDQDILEMLAMFGIHYAHVYYQSENFKYHLQFASMFLDKKKAFICFCPQNTDEALPYDGTCEYLSSDEILDNPSSFVIRMKKPSQTMSLNDALQGELDIVPDAIDSFVIMAHDKYPTHVFASACDDMLQGVSSVIRSYEYLLDAPREELIRTAIGYDQKIHYAHVAKLENDLSVKALLDEGFLPEAIINYLLLDGNTTPCEVFTLHDAREWFDLKKLTTTPLTFDKALLSHLNQKHIQRLSDMELSKRIGYACENIGKLAKLISLDVSTTYAIKQGVDAIFAKKELTDELEEASVMRELIAQAPYFEAFDDFVAYLKEKSDLSDETLETQLRFWITGSTQEKSLALIYPYIKTYLKEIVR